MNEDSVIVIDRQEEHKKRGALAVILAIAFIALLGIGSTFAYLTWTANQTPNRTTMGTLTADVLEPAYTNAALKDNGATTSGTDGTATYTAPTTATDAKYLGSDNVAIPKGAAFQIPGSYYAKNPFVVNTSTTADAYGFAGLKVQFQKFAYNDEDSKYEYVDMTDDDVVALLKCYYIGNLNTTDDGNTGTSKTTKAGFGDGTNSSLGTNWVQLLGTLNTTEYGDSGQTKGTSKDGAMYFINTKRINSLGSLDTQVTEKPDSSTWGYDASEGSTYATTPLFSTVRYIDTAAQSDIDALMNILDPAPKDESNSGHSVTTAGYTPGWRMVISGGIIQSTDAADDADAADGTWVKEMKGVLDDVYDGSSTTDYVNRTGTAKPTAATGMREGKSKLGSYMTATITNGTVTANTITEGKGVAEPSQVE